jgi:large conductance mechanosensitive channel
MLKEFKEFAFKGNVLDLAVGVIIGGAFGTIVKSLVEDVVMPLVTGVFGRVDYNNLFIALNGQSYATLQAAKDAGAPVVGYGSFLTNLINFLILAAVVYFFIVKPANRLRLSGAEEKTDLAEINVQQNEKIIALLEKVAAK